METLIDEIVGKEGESVTIYCNASQESVKMGQVLTFNYQTRRYLGSCVLGQNKCALESLYEGQYRLSVSNDMFQLVIVSLSESVIGTYSCHGDNDKILSQVDVKLSESSTNAGWSNGLHSCMATVVMCRVRNHGTSRERPRVGVDSRFGNIPRTSILLKSSKKHNVTQVTSHMYLHVQISKMLNFESNKFQF